MNRDQTPFQIDRSPRPAMGESDPWIGAKQFEWTGLAGGCLMTSGSAVLTCCLLILDGALVMAVLAAMAAGGVQWVNNEQASQFLLFSGPICLTIVQWLMIDTLRGIVRRQRRRKFGLVDHAE
ncbi:hypothetical protein [Allorhodopirellula heiligendammensis]|uniref:Uncharacterized protein n=1 Tax=Allorhodopirellula heiligendammensis TaxID=2714739 RepID=A0A5C6C3G0_9BACT|nr:hypothetical protein [Allorhodopirellula heiligendammensis]TWU18688.1 hypothetical protein Poly21_08530 [Allorhodopirellula heiligendammensis]